MIVEPDEILKSIENRASIFPKAFTSQPIEREKLDRLMQLANSAPTHRLTQPWRFKIVSGAGLDRLAEWLSNAYRQHTSKVDFSEVKFKKIKQKVLKSGAIIIICMQRDLKQSVPEWEEIAAVACAVQNIWIGCGSLGLGGYWSSPKTIDIMHEFVPLAEGEKCLGLFYIGYHKQPHVPKVRSSWREKIKWVED